MRQNGHVAEFTGRYDQTRADYDRTPIKPVLDGEPIYEDHPVSFNAKKLGHSIARRRAPAALLGPLQRRLRPHLRPPLRLADVDAGREPVNNPLMPWLEAIDQPGAAQMQHGRALIESRPFLTRVPDPDVVVAERVPTSVPGTGRYYFAATRDENGTYAMVYAPVGRTFSVRMDAIAGPSGEGLVVQPAQRRGDRDRRVPEYRRARLHAAGRRASCSTGCWCSTTHRRGIPRRVRKRGDNRRHSFAERREPVLHDGE